MATEQQIPKLASCLVEHQANFNALSTEDAQWVILHTVEAIALFVSAISGRVTKAVQTATAYLRRLYETEVIKIGAADGTETLVSSGLFWGGVYGVTLPKGDPTPTPEVEVTVHEQIKDGNFSQVFGEEAEELTEDQVCKFVRAHPDKLRRDGYATFFRVKGGFVASVGFDFDGRLDVRVRRFSDDDVWRAGCRHRFVLP